MSALLTGRQSRPCPLQSTADISKPEERTPPPTLAMTAPSALAGSDFTLRGRTFRSSARHDRLWRRDQRRLCFAWGRRSRAERRERLCRPDLRQCRPIDGHRRHHSSVTVNNFGKLIGLGTVSKCNLEVTLKTARLREKSASASLRSMVITRRPLAESLRFRLSAIPSIPLLQMSIEISGSASVHGTSKVTLCMSRVSSAESAPPIRSSRVTGYRELR